MMALKRDGETLIRQVLRIGHHNLPGSQW